MIPTQPQTDPFRETPAPMSEPQGAAPATPKNETWTLGPVPGSQHPPYSQAARGAPPPESPPEPITDHGYGIQKGMPARNFRQVLSVIAVVFILAYLILPTIQPTKPVPRPPEVPPTATAKADVLGSMKSAAPPVVAEVSAPVPRVESITTRSVTAVQEAKPASPNDKADLILASPMEAAIDLGSAPTSGQKSAADSPIAEVIRQSMAMQERLVSQMGTGNVAQPGTTGTQGTGSPQFGAGANGSTVAGNAFAKTFEDRNRDFLKQNDLTAAPSALPLQGAGPVGTLYQGAIVQAAFDVAVRTDLPGQVRATVTRDVYEPINMREILIPRGTKMILAYNSAILMGQERILFAAQRLIFPNGTSVMLGGSPATDAEGAAGVPAEVNNHFWQQFGTTFLIGAASLLLPKDQQTVVSSQGMGTASQMASIAGQTLNSVVARILERNASIGPTAHIEAGTSFSFMVTRDLRLAPYQGRTGG